MDKELIKQNCSVPKLERNKNINSVLNVEVSCFKNYLTPSNPTNINLLEWLSSGDYKPNVEKIRETKDKNLRDGLKSKLPAITPSGLFSIRNEKSLIQHSGLIQFDIDLKENYRLGNFYELKQQIRNIPNVAYCGLSVSGQGFWGLIPIAHINKHREHFDELQIAFLKLGIAIDVKPRNVCSLRGFSYDPEPYFNHQAEVFTKIKLIPKTKVISFTSSKFSTPFNHEKERVEIKIAEILKTGIDITGTYAAWFEIGCSFANTFGEDGRYYFHQVSQLHPEYSIYKTDKQYDSCLRGGYNYTIASFFKYSNY